MLGDAMKKKRWNFKTQAPMFDADRLYIVDFLLQTQREPLVIEIDGPSHNGKECYDAARTQWIRTQRQYAVIRFTAKEVLLELPRVMGILRAYFPRSI